MNPVARTHAHERVCATRAPPFVSVHEQDTTQPYRTRTLIKPECALPSRIVKELQPSTLVTGPIKSVDCCRLLQSIVLPRSLVCSLLPDLCYLLWWSRTGSNRRPPACKAGALPTELRPRCRFCYLLPDLCYLMWWVWMDSNHRPPPYQDGALTS